MTFDEGQAEVLTLDPKARASLARKLLESLEALSDGENAQQWAEESERRDAGQPCGRHRRNRWLRHQRD